MEPSGPQGGGWRCLKNIKMIAEVFFPQLPKRLGGQGLSQGMAFDGKTDMAIRGESSAVVFDFRQGEEPSQGFPEAIAK